MIFSVRFSSKGAGVFPEGFRAVVCISSTLWLGKSELLLFYLSWDKEEIFICSQDDRPVYSRYRKRLE